MNRRHVLSVLIAAAASTRLNPVSAQRSGAAVPYGIDKRPMPAGTDLEVLVPKTVGTFERPPLPKGAKPPVNEDLNVSYVSGTDKVDFGFSIPESPADAHEAVNVARDEASASKVDMRSAQYVSGRDPSYFKSADFMAWTRGRYFFYAKASSAPALDRFMQQFPF